MDLKKLFKNKLYFVSLLLPSIIFICFIAFQMRNTSFTDDDFFYAFYTSEQNLFTSLDLNSVHGGGYFGLLLLQFFAFFIPNLFGIHPSDFIGFPLGIINGFLGIITFLIFAKFITIFKKSKILYCLTFSFLILYFILSYIEMYNCTFIYTNYIYYRYFLSLFFLGYFILYIYKNITKSETGKTNYISLFFASICGYIIGASAEMLFSTVIIFSLLIVLYNLGITLISKFITNPKFIFSYKFKLNHNFYIPMFFCYFASYRFMTTDVFKSVVFSERGISDFSATLNTAIANLKEFYIMYTKIYIFDIWIFYFILFFIIIFAVFIYKKGKIKRLAFPVLFQIAIMVAYSLLIFNGKNFISADISVFFLKHNKLIFLYKWLILIPLFISVSYFIKISIPYIRKIKIEKFFIIISSVFFFILPFLINHIDYPKFIMVNESYKDCKKFDYIGQKIMQFYYLQDKVPQIPYILVKNNTVLKWIENFEDSNDSYYKESRILPFYKTVYKSDNSYKLGFNINENAINEFYNNGGAFYNKEMENIKYSRLLDKNFVLNKNVNSDMGDKLSADEMNKYLETSFEHILK